MNACERGQARERYAVAMRHLQHATRAAESAAQQATAQYLAGEWGDARTGREHKIQRAVAAMNAARVEDLAKIPVKVEARAQSEGSMAAVNARLLGCSEEQIEARRVAAVSTIRARLRARVLQGDSLALLILDEPLKMDPDEAAAVVYARNSHYDDRVVAWQAIQARAKGVPMWVEPTGRTAGPETLAVHERTVAFEAAMESIRMIFRPPAASWASPHFQFVTVQA